MYRQRIHMTARDAQGWNEIVDATNEINGVLTRHGQPTAVLWTQTVGVFNELIAEIDYPSLADFEAWTKALYGDPEATKQLSRISSSSVDGKGYTELFEHAGSVG